MRTPFSLQVCRKRSRTAASYKKIFSEIEVERRHTLVALAFAQSFQSLVYRVGLCVVVSVNRDIRTVHQRSVICCRSFLYSVISSLGDFFY